MEIIHINNISKSFGANKVLENINLEISAGEIAGLIGLNGIGKTTLIKILLGLINSFEGKCKLFNKLSTNPEARRNTFYLPEKFNPPLQLTGYEFIKASNNFYRTKTTLKFLEECCYKIRFDFSKINCRMSSYSKGMIQKIGLLAMITSNTALWILDEPMSGLDPVSRFELKQILKAKRESQDSVLFTSHLLSDVEEIADRILILHNAEICFNGSLQQLFNKYNSDNIEKAYLTVIKYE